MFSTVQRTVWLLRNRKWRQTFDSQLNFTALITPFKKIPSYIAKQQLLCATKFPYMAISRVLPILVSYNNPSAPKFIT